MPDIDSLSIRVEASVEKALPSFNKLIDSLNGINSTLSRSGSSFNIFTASVGNATTALKNLDSSIRSININSLMGKLELLKRIDLSNLNKTLNFNIKLDGATQVQKNVQAFQDASEKISAIADRSADDIIQKYGITSKKLQAELKSLFTDIGKWEGSNGAFSLNSSAVDEIGKKIVEAATATKESVSGSLDYAEQEWKEFFDYVNSHKLQYTKDVEDIVKSQQLIGRYKEGGENLFNIFSKKGGTNIDNSWSTFTSYFPNVIKDTDYLSDRIDQLISKYLEAKEMFSRQSLSSISFSDGYGGISTGEDVFWQDYVNKISEVGEQAKAAVEQAKAQLDTSKIYLDIGVNEEKIASDIQTAISRAMTAAVKPVTLDLKIDASKIRDSIASQLRGIDVSNISGIADALKNLHIASENLRALSGIDLKSFANQINKISLVDPAKLQSVITSIFGLSQVLATPPEAQGFADSMQSVLTAISGFSRKSIQTAIDNMPRLGTAINSMITSIASAPTINQSNVAALTSISQMDFTNMRRGGQLSQTSGAMRSMSSSMRGLGTSARSMNTDVTKFFKTIGTKAASGIRSAAGSISDFASRLLPFSNKTKSATISISGLVSAAMRLYTRFFMLRRIISLFTSAITKSMNYIESYHYFQVAMDKVGEQAKSSFAEYGYESAEAYAESFKTRALELNEKMSGFTFDQNGVATSTGQKSLGLDSDTLLQYQAQYAQMADSIGMTGEAALATSKALTMLAGDWSSLRNISFSSSYEKMASALAGQSRAVRSLGIDITQAALAQTAADIGLTTSIMKMSQAEKAQLRMITMINQSKVAWGDLANTLNTPANQMRMLQQNTQALVRTLGNLFLPVVAKILPYVNALTMALQRLLQWLAKFLGIDLGNIVTSQGGLGDTVGDLIDDDDIGDLADSADDASSALDDANESAKELKRTVLSFDELHILNSPDTSSSTGTGNTGSGSTGSTGLSADESGLLDNALLDALSDYEKAWNAAFENMVNKAGELADAIANCGKVIWGFIENKAWEDLGSYLAGIVNSGLDWLFEKVNWDNIRSVITPAIEGLAMTLNGLVSEVHWEELGEWIAGGVNTVFEALYTWYTTFDFKQLGRNVMSGLMEMVREINWYTIGEFLGAKFQSGWSMLAGLVEEWKPEDVGKALADLFNGVIAQVNFVEIGLTLSSAFNKAFQTLGDFLMDFDKDNQLGAKLGHGINVAIANLDPLGAADTLNEFFEKVIAEIKATDVEWEQLGQKVAMFIGGIKWLDHFIEITDIITTALEGFFSGLLSQALGDFGENFADGFVEGVKNVIALDETAIKGISDALSDLADALNLLPPELVKDLGGALGTFFAISIEVGLGFKIASVATGLFGLNKVVGGAAGTTLASNCKILSGGLESLFAVLSSAGGIAGGAIAGAVTIAEDLQSIADAAKGGNGDLTELGGTVDSLLEKLEEANKILPEQNDAIFAIKETLEDTEGSIEDYTEALANAFNDQGFTTDEIRDAIGRIKAECSLSQEQVEMLDGALERFESIANDSAVEAERLAEKLDFKNSVDLDAAGVSLDEFVASMRGSISDLQVYADDASIAFNNLEVAINTIEGSGATANEAFQSIYDMCDSLGIPIEKLVESIETSFPNAVNAASNATDGLVSDLGSVAKESENAEQKAKPLNEILNSLASEMSLSDSIKIALVASSLKTLSENSGDADGKLNTLSEKLDFLKDKTEFAGTVDEIATSLENAGVKSEEFYSALEQAIIDSGESIPSSLESIGESLENSGKTAGENAGTGLKSGIEESLSNVEDSAKDLAQKGVVDPLKDTLQEKSPSKVTTDIGTNAGTGLKNGLDKSASSVNSSSKELATGLVKEIETKLKVSGSSSEWARTTGQLIPNGIKSGINQEKNSLLNDVKNLASDIVAKFNTIKDDIARQFNGLRSRIEQEIGDLSPIGSNCTSMIANGLSSGMGNVSSQASSLVEAIKSPFNGIGSVGESFGRDFAYGFANGIASVNIRIPHITYTGSSSVTYDGGTISYPNFAVQWYAKGGLFTKPTLAGFGEAGNEAALPLTNKAVMSQIARAITESGGYGGMDRDDMMEAVATGVAMAMSQNPQTAEIVVHSILKTNDETLAQSVERGRAKLDMRYNATPSYGY